jgi:methyl-accepting chemotaxis protein
MGDINDVVGGNLKDDSNSKQRINHMVTDAVRSLQFEDIVRQLTESSKRHLDYLEEVLSGREVRL